MTRAADQNSGPGARRSSRLADTLLVAISIAVCVVVAEGVVRHLNGQPLFVFPLTEVVGTTSVASEQVDRIPLAEGVDRKWFYSDPSLPNRSDPPEGWTKLYYQYRDHPSSHNEFQPVDNFKVWNSAFVGDPCAHRFLRHAPGKLYVYDPPDGAKLPPYRFYPNVTLPDGLVTNQIGWRGPLIEVPRGGKTVRIVFVGASTTVDGHNLPFSHPEFVGHWLNLWAKAKGLDVRFEVLNAGRESVQSPDIAEIVHSEVLPLRPDLVVYYEGANEFRPASIVDKVPEGSPVRPAGAQATTSPGWLNTLARYSALMGRVQAAIGLGASDAVGHEWPKPDYRVVWPPGLDEQDPDLAYPNLPVSLNTIQRSLDRIRSELASAGTGELAVSSFLWIVRDGLVLDPVRGKYIIDQLNIANYPFHYRELERLAKFQNRVFAKYAAAHGLTFVDFARDMPFDPNLFIDAVHLNYAGVRLQGWIALQQLLPTIDKHLKDGSWPAPAKPDLPLPTFTPRQITLSCAKGA